MKLINTLIVGSVLAASKGLASRKPTSGSVQEVYETHPGSEEENGISFKLTSGVRVLAEENREFYKNPLYYFAVGVGNKDAPRNFPWLADLAVRVLHQQYKINDPESKFFDSEGYAKQDVSFVKFQNVKEDQGAALKNFRKALTSISLKRSQVGKIAEDLFNAKTTIKSSFFSLLLPRPIETNMTAFSEHSLGKFASLNDNDWNAASKALHGFMKKFYYPGNFALYIQDGNLDNIAQTIGNNFDLSKAKVKSINSSFLFLNSASESIAI